MVTKGTLSPADFLFCLLWEATAQAVGPRDLLAFTMAAQALERCLRYSRIVLCSCSNDSNSACHLGDAQLILTKCLSWFNISVSGNKKHTQTCFHHTD